MKISTKLCFSNLSNTSNTQFKLTMTLSLQIASKPGIEVVGMNWRALPTPSKINCQTDKAYYDCIFSLQACGDSLLFQDDEEGHESD